MRDRPVFLIQSDPGMARGEEAVDKICDDILTLFDQDGMLLNINIIDAKKILEADKDPMKYPDLVVRVTGFTAFFAMLSPKFRKLVVDRVRAVNGDDI